MDALTTELWGTRGERGHITRLECDTCPAFFLIIRLESVISFFSFTSKSPFHLSYTKMVFEISAHRRNNTLPRALCDKIDHSNSFSNFIAVEYLRLNKSKTSRAILLTKNSEINCSVVGVLLMYAKIRTLLHFLI